MNVSQDVIKKGKHILEIKPDEHVKGYTMLQLFLKATRNKNSTVQYEIIRSDSNEFKAVYIILANAAISSQYCLDVVGIDAAHMKSVIMTTSPRTEINETTVTVVSGRNHEDNHKHANTSSWLPFRFW